MNCDIFSLNTLDERKYAFYSVRKVNVINKEVRYVNIIIVLNVIHNRLCIRICRLYYCIFKKRKKHFLETKKKGKLKRIRNEHRTIFIKKKSS